MAQEKSTQERLLNTIKAIVANPNNEWFTNELRKALGVPSAPVYIVNSSVEKEVRLIREALNIRGNQSIDYSFVKSDVIRKQLIVDNLRMEDAALNINVKDFSKRLSDFSLNAFYQVECLVNYYYGTVYGECIVEHIQDSLNKSGYPRELTKFERENGLNAITIANKLTALGVDLNLDRYVGASLYYLRELRNGSSHRPFTKKEIQNPEEKEKENKKKNFWRNQGFESIRSLLSSFVSIIQKDLSAIRYLPATVTNVLPSAGFISIKGKGSFSIPLKLLNQNPNCKQKGSEVLVGVSYGSGKMRIEEVK